jgi:predicted nucleic acid-binding protein
LNKPVLLDTGPLVAILNDRDQFHDWALEQARYLPSPYLTCESVLSEAWFLLRQHPGARNQVVQLITRGQISVPFRIEPEAFPIEKLLVKYSDRPMTIADACLVRMSEQYPQGFVWTIDSDFKIYRKSNRQVIPVLMPDHG